MSRVPYGYRQAQDGEGITIDTECAGVVRRIFQDYADARSPLQIAEALTAEGVCAPLVEADPQAPPC